MYQISCKASNTNTLMGNPGIRMRAMPVPVMPAENIRNGGGTVRMPEEEKTDRLSIEQFRRLRYGDFIKEELKDSKMLPKYISKVRGIIQERLKDLSAPPWVANSSTMPKADSLLEDMVFSGKVVKMFSEKYLPEDASLDARFMAAEQETSLGYEYMTEAPFEFVKELASAGEEDEGTEEGEDRESFLNELIKTRGENIGATRCVHMREYVDNAITGAIKQFLKIRAAADPGINKGNFMTKAVPETNAEVMAIISTAYNIVAEDFERGLFRLATTRLKEQEGFFEQVDEIRENYLEEKKKHEKEMQELRTENKRLAERIATLEGALERKNTKEAAPVPDKEALRAAAEANKENRELRKKLDLVTEELEGLKSFLDEADSEFDPDEEAGIDEILPDRERKYAFICTHPEAFKWFAPVLDRFPNSVMLKQAKNIDRNTTDAIVTINQHINHSSYYLAKNIAKASGIPFLQVTSNSCSRMIAELEGWDGKSGMEYSRSRANVV